MSDDPETISPRPSRRSFLVTTGTTEAATVVGAMLPAHANTSNEQSGSSSALLEEPKVEGAVPIVLAHQRQRPQSSHRPSNQPSRLHP
jgi:hypothetical protein